MGEGRTHHHGGYGRWRLAPHAVAAAPWKPARQEARPANHQWQKGSGLGHSEDGAARGTSVSGRRTPTSQTQIRLYYALLDSTVAKDLSKVLVLLDGGSLHKGVQKVSYESYETLL